MAELIDLDWASVRGKATGFGRVYFDVNTALRETYAANPDALMFGSDLPSTRAPRSYCDNDYALVIEALGEEAAGKVLCGNAFSIKAGGNRHSYSLLFPQQGIRLLQNSGVLF